jgi:hypothetical protein
MILESSNDISGIIHFLDQKVIHLRRKYPKSRLLPKIKLLYDEVIIPWMENYKLQNKEMEFEEDEEMKNILLDWINTINEILSK